MRKYIHTIICSVLSAFLAVGFFYTFFPKQKVIYHSNETGQFVKEKDLLNSDKYDRLFRSAYPTDFTGAAKNSREAVVFIRALSSRDSENRFIEEFNASTGSGVIISPDGYIATNHHVIEEGIDVEVMLNNNKEYKAKVVGIDASTDLALLKIEEDNLPFLIFGNSDSLQIGEWVMAVGNPFRLQSTVTAGIVSAKARNINILEGQKGIESFIQTDAAVNPGNSGGALVNTIGELVGINSAIISSSGRYEGFSFAIPANLAKKILYDLKEYGVVQRGWMGVSIINMDDTKAQGLGLDFVSGVYLDMVNKNSAAQEAGLRRKDVIVSVNGISTNSVPEFMEQVGRYRPGDKITVDFYRFGKKKKVTVVLRNQLNTTDFVAVRKDKVLTDLGFELRELDSDEKKTLSTEGAYVVSVYKNSTVGKANMDPGYIIKSVNGTRVTTVNEVIKLLDGYKGEVVLEGIYEHYPGSYPYRFLTR